VAAAALVCLVAPTVAVLVYDVPGNPATRRQPLIWLTATAIIGALLPFLYWAPYRVLGLVVYTAFAWFLAAAHGVYWHAWPGWAHGLCLGLIVGSLARGRSGPEREDENYVLVAAILLGGGIAWGFVVFERPYTAAGYFVLATALALLVWSVARLFRPLFEITCEPFLWLMYKAHARGPGLADFPPQGPCLVIANHACWLDPIFLEKVLPRPITPMMTARFFDLPVIRQLVVAFGVIRVPEKAIKKDAPELKEAIAALDRGECVVIFPEGYLRRSEERPLRRFGQGIWQILQARPDTPVYACWIEGGWGSYTSYFNGPPTKNKKKDFRRPLTIGISAPATVPAKVLEEHLPTRIHLMNLVAAARTHLGLPALPPFELPVKDEESFTTEDTESTEIKNEKSEN
jgi:1-acyl-sn-glycerol-3-phosphate acyltransferase